MTAPIARLAGLLFLFSLALSEAASPAEPPFAGVDANYSLQMEKDGKSWHWDSKTADLFRGMAKEGARGFRVRLWTGDEGQNGKAYALEVTKRSLAAGLEPYLAIFLSEDWADLMKQPLPKVWTALGVDQRAEAVRTYSRNVVAEFRKAGLLRHLYEIGNEIDYGIAGVYPNKGAKKNPAALSRTCWPDEAKLIFASEEGVKEADPEAKFLLHVAHWWDPDFCIAFYRFMLDHGVEVDYTGLSYYPSSDIGGSLEIKQFLDVANRISQAVKRPLIVPEVAYPSTNEFKGQFSRWKKETPGYPLTPDGQRRWLEDFLDACAHTPAIAEVYYWSPEWYGEGMWKAFALFDVAGNAKPAWTSFAADRTSRPAPKTPVFFEMRGDRLYPVPVDPAKQQAIAVLEEKLKRFGRVNMDYIKDITATPLVVNGYSVNLRASLSGNIDLALADAAGGTQDWQSSLSHIDPAKEELVLFTPDEKAPDVSHVLEFAKNRGLETLVHPRAADLPLRFGLGNDWQKASAESPEAPE